MNNGTSRLGKHRVYYCCCGHDIHVALKPEDTRDGQLPQSCFVCGRRLSDQPFEIVDSMRDLEDRIAVHDEERGA